MTDELFSRRLPITIKSQDREDRKGCIQVTVEMHTTVNPIHRKELVVRLTDEQDLFFLYTLTLTEEDFQGLKLQQGLLVDFSAFPQQFISLLNSCLEEEHKEVPKFMLMLVVNGSSAGNSTANLNVIETNPFKHLTHLSLKFLPAADTDLKKYLADCLKHLKEERTCLMEQLNQTQTSLSLDLRQAREALATRTTELQSIRAESRQQAKQLATEHAQSMNIHTQSALQTQSEAQQRHEKEKKDIGDAHHKTMKELQGKLHDLDAANKNLLERCYKSELNERDLRARLSAAIAEVEHVRHELKEGRRVGGDRDADYAELERSTSALKTHLSAVEAELKEKMEVARRTGVELITEKEAKRKCEEEFERKKRHVGKLEATIKTMSEELMKGNEIIKKLQGDIRNYHTKLKLRSQVTTEQEKLLNEKTRELEQTRKELETAQSQLRQQQEENKKLNDSLETTMAKLEESRQLLKTNENVINWLNKQVTEVQLTSSRPQLPRNHPDMNSTTASASSFRPQLQLYGGGGQSYGSRQPSTVHTMSPHPNTYQMVRRTGVPPGVPRSQLPLANSSPITRVELTRITTPVSQPEGILDVKYLQPTGGATNMPSVAISAPQPIESRPTQPPLASAYFPTGSKLK